MPNKLPDLNNSELLDAYSKAVADAADTRDAPLIAPIERTGRGFYLTVGVLVVFILWGRDAQRKKKLIDTSRHTIIESSHPSPQSAYKGFFGSKPFSRTNCALLAAGEEEIDWRLTQPW